VDQMMPFTRVVQTVEGGSAFEDDEFPLSSQPMAAGLPPSWIGQLKPSAGAPLFVHGTEKLSGEPHPAPRRQWIVAIRGVFEVEVTNGERRRFGPGDILFVSDTDGTGHRTFTIGPPPFDVLFVPAE
jgi:hypothetical protein